MKLTCQSGQQSETTFRVTEGTPLIQNMIFIFLIYMVRILSLGNAGPVIVTVHSTMLAVLLASRIWSMPCIDEVKVYLILKLSFMSLFYVYNWREREYVVHHYPQACNWHIFGAR